MTLLDSLGLGDSGNSGDSSLTPESIAQRRRLAEALLQQGQSDTPIRHWSQGANRVLQSMLGTYRLGQLDKQDRDGSKAANSQIASIFGGAATSPASPSPAITPSAPFMAPPQPATPAQGAAAAAGRNPAPAGPLDATEFIKQQESYAPVAKWDVRQNSGGYGSRAESGEAFTPEKAEQYLQRDMQPSMAWIDKNVPNATPAQRTALASFGYNLGTDDLDKLLPDIQRGDWATVGRRMLSFNNTATGPNGALEVNNGLTARRLREAALLQGSGASPAAPSVAPAGDALLPPSAASRLQRQALELMKNPRNAALGRELLIKAALAEAPKDPESVREYALAVKQGYNKTFMDYQIEMKRAGRSAAQPPSGYRTTPDGNLAAIPGGPADPATNNKQVKYTEGQTKAANFGNMMTKAEEELLAAAPKGPDGKPGAVANPKSIFGAARDGLVPIEGMRNAMRPDETQAYEQSARQWIRAKLRKESGAVIGEDEMQKEFETYFPQYWDGPKTVALKARAREEATKGMIAESGNAYKQLFVDKNTADSGSGRTDSTTRRVNSAEEAQRLIQSGELKSGDSFMDENGNERVVN